MAPVQYRDHPLRRYPGNLRAHHWNTWILCSLPAGHRPVVGAQAAARPEDMVMTLNHHELDQMKVLADNLGVQFRFDPILNPAQDGSARPTHLRLTPEEIVALEEADPDRISRWAEIFRNNQYITSSERNMYRCGAGKQGFHIDANGRLCLCLSARQPSYDLRSGSFKEGWGNILSRDNCTYL